MQRLEPQQSAGRARLAGQSPRTTSRRPVLGATVRAGGALVAAGTAAFPAVVGAASRVTFSYGGITCLAGVAVAMRQGFFSDEGLEVNAIAVPPDNPLAMLRGEIDASHATAYTLSPPFLRDGVALGDIVVTAGLQTGGIALVVAPDSPIRDLAGLRGQKIAAAPVWRWMLAPVLSAIGVDPGGIEWQAGLGAGPAATALREGQVAAAFVADPFATAMAGAGTGRILAMNNDGMMDDYCCSLSMPAALVRSDRPKAAAITRAVMRGNAWAQTNKSAAAEIQVELGQVNASAADNVRAIATVEFKPAVAAARQNTLDMLMHAKQFGFLDAATDEMALLNRIFVPVTGELGATAQLPRGLPRTGGAVTAAPGLLGAGAALAALGTAFLWQRRRPGV